MWSVLNNDLFVVRSPGFEDFRAVLCSKASRSTDLSTKANMTQNEINTFLTQNLANYGHASIGEMSVPTVYHKGFSWLSAYFLEDNPLFIGQEMSTRVIDPTKSGISIDSKDVNGAEESFRVFADIFNKLKTNISTTQHRRAYKFDDIRWALPSNVQTGVVMTMNSRVAVRHLNQLENAVDDSLSFMKTVINKYRQGIKECSPFVFEALDKTSQIKQPVQHRWKQLNYILQNFSTDNLSADTLLQHSIHIRGPPLYDCTWFNEIEPRKASKQYLDPEFKRLGVFSVEIFCSIAAARDWHRHRAAMPWTLELVLDNNHQPKIAPWFDQGEFKSVVKKTIEKHFITNGRWDSLLVLPFGTLVKLTCYVDLPSLLYMLELRAFSEGANFEYQAQARAGLEQLRMIIGMDFCNRNHIYSKEIVKQCI